MSDHMTPFSSGKDRYIDSTSISYQSGYQPPIVLVKKIPQSITEHDLKLNFQNFGDIKEVSILQPKLYAYVEFSVL
jgi:RNA recognition motif-containing protein